MMIDPLAAKNMVVKCIANFALSHGEPPKRVRVGGELYLALVVGPHSGLIDVGGVSVYFDPTLPITETIGLASI